MCGHTFFYIKNIKKRRNIKEKNKLSLGKKKGEEEKHYAKKRRHVEG